VIGYIKSGSRDGAQYADGRAVIGYRLPIVIPEPGTAPGVIWMFSGMSAPAPELDISIEQAMSAKRAKLSNVSGYDRRILLLTRELPEYFAFYTEEEIAARVRQENGVPGYFDAIFLVDLLSVGDALRAAHGGEQEKWPPVLRFGWAVRNAFAHDGKILFKNPNATSVTWRGFTYGPPDNGHQILYTDLMDADVIILMEEMDDAIPR
jgi:hypothetical protein